MRLLEELSHVGYTANRDMDPLQVGQLLIGDTLIFETFTATLIQAIGSHDSHLVGVTYVNGNTEICLE